MTSSNEYPNTFPVRFKKVLPAHRICRNALVSAEQGLNCPGSIILSQNWRRAQTAATGWHQGQRHSPLDDQSFAGKVTQDQFTLLATHVDVSPGSTSYCQQAWNEQPGPVQTGRILLTPGTPGSALAPEAGASHEHKWAEMSTTSTSTGICAPKPCSAAYPHPSRNQNLSLNDGQKTPQERKRGFLKDTASEGCPAVWSEMSDVSL